MSHCVECTAYTDAIRVVCAEAEVFLRERGLALPSEVIVFDIDGTALDDRRVEGQRARAMPRHDPVFELYTLVLALGYRVVFISARDKTFREGTEENLRSQGYETWHELILFPGRAHERSPSRMCTFKSQARAAYAEKIVACIGDMDADVTGDHIGLRQWRLPEPPAHTQCVIM